MAKGRRRDQKSESCLPTIIPSCSTGCAICIRAEDDFELVGEAASGLAALKVIREKRPDVAVLDISMPELNGIVLSRRLDRRNATS